MVLYVSAAVAVSALVQVLLGGSVPVLILAILSVVFGLLGLGMLGARNVGAWVAMFFVAGNTLVPIVAKSILLQPIASYLYAPLMSFAALAIVSAELLLALVIVHRVNLGHDILIPKNEPRFLHRFSSVCFFAGLVFWLLNRLLQGPAGGGGFGGLAIFRGLLIMAVIARTAALIERSGRKRSIDAPLVCILAISVFLGLLGNSKTQAALPVVGYFVTLVAYKRGLRPRTMLALGGGVVLFVGLIAPMVQGLRALGQQQMSPGERVEFVATHFTTLVLNPVRIGAMERLAAPQMSSGYYDYFGQDGAYQTLLGRYASVQQIDPVIASVNRSQPWGGSAIWPAFARLVPSVIYPNKPKYTEAYHTLVHYGLINPAGGKFPTLPLTGQAYAAYGVLGVVVIPFLTFLAFLLVLKKLGWNLRRNIYAVFFLCSFVLVYVNQGDFGQFAGATLRTFPILAVTFLVFGRLCRMRIRPHRMTMVRQPAEGGT